MQRNIKILFVCHGNICRSPMAEYVMKDLVEKAGVAELFYIDSAALHTDEIGNPVHYGTQDILEKQGVLCGNHRARLFQGDEAHEWDFIIGMDSANMADLRRKVPVEHRDKLYLLLEFAGSTQSIADPWYTGDFSTTYDDVLAGCRGLLSFLLPRM